MIYIFLVYFKLCSYCYVLPTLDAHGKIYVCPLEMHLSIFCVQDNSFENLAVT